MTTNHHTPLPFGGELTSAAMTAPLGELDAAIDAVTLSGSGNTTTLTAQANAGQKNMVVADRAGWLVGDAFWIGDSGGTQESGSIASGTGAGAGTLVAVANLANTYAIGKLVSRSPAELVAARGTFTTLGARVALLETRVYDVKRYGAIGNGVANDVAAIQAAIDAANAASGGVVYIPNGTYVIGTPGLVLQSGVTIQGAGWGSILVANGNYPAINCITETRVAVRDLRITGSANVANTLNRGVQFATTTQYGLISNVYVDGCYRGIQVITDCSYITIEKCIVLNDQSDVGAIDVGTCEKVSVINCSVISPRVHGIDIREGGASAKGYNRVIGCHVQSAGSCGIVLSASSATGVALPGCEIIGCSVVASVLVGIVVENGCQYTRVANNLVKDSTGTGILIGKGTGDANLATVVEGNIVRNSGNHGIHSLDCNYTNIIGNRVAVFVDDGIRINGGTIGGNHVVADNGVDDGTSTAGRAIYIYGAANDTVVSGNACRNNAGMGIRVDGSTSCSITGNTVVDSDNTGVLTIGGISVDATSHRTVISGNISRRISGTKQDYGVAIGAATNCLVIGNMLFQNTTGAILDGGTGTSSVNNVST